MSVRGLMLQVCKKESVFQHFHMYFCILSPLHDISPCRTNKKSVFFVDRKSADTKASTTIITERIATVLSRHSGVITRRVKEKSAALHSKQEALWATYLTRP